MAACLEAADSRPQHLSCPTRQAGAFSFWGCGQRATPTRVPLSISFHPRREPSPDSLTIDSEGHFDHVVYSEEVRAVQQVQLH